MSFVVLREFQFKVGDILRLPRGTAYVERLSDQTPLTTSPSDPTSLPINIDPELSQPDGPMEHFQITKMVQKTQSQVYEGIQGDMVEIDVQGKQTYRFREFGDTKRKGPFLIKLDYFYYVGALDGEIGCDQFVVNEY